MNVTVVGAGSWGTAAAIQLALGGHEVLLWARRPE
ncbi:MAG: NAD(P)-dependent glycerol-3-phosphate dehydrogenase, partial [Coriobacteriales bacterium]|nr:NAD(P)-dependent glycerol-3-phosphate dehydrogenase [Coriobacteriales bacterium]